MFKNSQGLDDSDKMIDETEESQLKKERIVINKQNFVKKWSCSITEVYLIDKKLGQGSFGTVYLVTHKQLKVKRALKVIKKASRSSSDPIDELELLKKLDHPNIIKIYQYYESPKKWYIVTEYFEGKELFDQIIELGSFSEQLAVKIIYEILKALIYIHSKGIAHRDIKAENILVKKSGDEYVVKVIDWGLGVLTNGQDLYRRCGTPQYCAPEVLMGCYSLECDMWGLGVLIYIMLSGYMPFKGANLNETITKVKKGEVNLKSSIWANVSQQAKQLIHKLLQKNISKRLKAFQCLNQPWIQKNLSKNNPQINLKDTLQRLKQFRSENRLHIIVINYILNFIEVPHQIQHLKRQFQLLDTNQDGQISYQELLTAYKRIYGPQADLIVQKIFKNIDLDGSGAITFSEFITFASVITNDFNNQQLQEAFKLFDSDSDGLIDKKELNNLITYEKGSTESTQFYEMLNQIDLNNDGKIDFNEFIQHVYKAAEKIKTKSSSFKSQSKSNKQEDKELEKTFVLSDLKNEKDMNSEN